MSLNPYEPATDLGPEVQEESEIVPPRYMGEPIELKVHIEESEAIWQIRNAIDIPLEKSQTTANSMGSWLSTIFSILLAVTAVVVVQFFPQAAISTLGFICLGGFVLFVVLVAIAWIAGKFLNHPKRADPPVGGERVFRIRELGWSVQQPLRDGRWIEVYCAWRQTLLQQSKPETAWLLHTGMNNPLVFLRTWVQNFDQSVAVETLAKDVALWRSEHPFTGTLDDVPDEALEFFPELEGTGFTTTALKEKETRKKQAKIYRREIPSLAPSPKTLPWKLLFASLALSPIAMAIAWALGIRSTVTDAFFIPLVFLSIMILILWRRIHKNASEKEVAGSLSSYDLWLNYRTVLIRHPLEGFPTRYLLDDTALVLESADQKTSFIFDRSMFQSEEAFRQACSLVGAEELLTK